MIENITVITQGLSAPLFFLQTCDHIEISPEDPYLGVDVVGYLVQVLEEGFLVSWSRGSIDICDVALFAQANKAKGGFDGPFRGENTIK
jgi:hypothetical protein